VLAPTVIPGGGGDLGVADEALHHKEINHSVQTMKHGSCSFYFVGHRTSEAFTMRRETHRAAGKIPD
jgi:hypothetical protein